MRFTLHRHPQTVDAWLYRDEAIRMVSFSIGGLVGLFTSQFFISQSIYLGVLIEFVIILALFLLADNIFSSDETLKMKIKEVWERENQGSTFTKWSLQNLSSPKAKVFRYFSIGAAGAITAGVFLINLDVLGMQFPLLMAILLYGFLLVFIFPAFVLLDEEYDPSKEEIEEGIVP